MNEVVAAVRVSTAPSAVTPSVVTPPPNSTAVVVAAPESVTACSVGVESPGIAYGTHLLTLVSYAKTFKLFTPPVISTSDQSPVVACNVVIIDPSPNSANVAAPVTDPVNVTVGDG